MSLLLALLAQAAVQSTSSPPPVPPPVAQSVADCRSTSYASDQLVCANEELLRLDRQLAALLPFPEPIAAAVIEPQGDWFRRSRMCAMRSDHFVCLRAAYRERIAIGSALRGKAIAEPAWRETKCKRGTVELADIGHGVTAVRRGTAVWLALSATELPSWTPFAWTARTPPKLELHGPDGKMLRCKVS